MAEAPPGGLFAFPFIRVHSWLKTDPDFLLDRGVGCRRSRRGFVWTGRGFFVLLIHCFFRVFFGEPAGAIGRLNGLVIESYPYGSY